MKHRRWRLKARDELSGREAKELFAAVLRRLHTEIDRKDQAQVNTQNSQAVANLVQSLRDVPSACITLGSLVIVKWTVDGKENVQAKELTALEERALRQSPWIRMDPNGFFERLSEATTLLAIEAAEGPEEQDPPTSNAG